MRIGFRTAIIAVLFSTIFFATATFTPTRAHADGPVAVVTLNNFDELFGDFAYLAEAVGFSQIGQMGTMMGGQFTNGLDTTKPIGITVRFEEGELKAMGMLPVKDLDTFLSGLEAQIGEPKDAGGGILELAGPVPVYLKKQGDWAFVTQSSDDLAKLPSDPMKSIAQLAGAYDIAIRGFIQNIPKDYRDLAIAQIREGVEMQLDNLPESEDSEAQKKMIENAIRQYEDLFNGLDKLTIGIGVEPDNRKVVIDSNMTSVAGTKLAKQFALLNDLKSRFGGFLMPNAAITMHGMTKVLPEDAENGASSFEALVPQIMKGINEGDKLDENQKALAEKIARPLLEVVKETIATGEMDMGLSVLLGNSFDVIGGIAVSDGGKVEAAIKDAAKSVTADEVTFSLGADQHAGVRMHKISIATDPGDEEAQKFIGESLDVILGVADKSVYIAAGEQGMSYLRRAIDSSASAAGKNVLPMRMRVSVREIMKFVKQFEDDETVAAVVDELEKSGADQSVVMLIGKPIPGGAQYRFEVREGVLKAIGRAVEFERAEAAGNF